MVFSNESLNNSNNLASSTQINVLILLIIASIYITALQKYAHRYKLSHNIKKLMSFAFEQKRENELSSFVQKGMKMGFIKIKIHCQYCGEYLCEATEVICGHIFCNQCIKFYLLYLDQCPVCQIALRNTRIFRNIPLDNIIEDYINQKDRKSVTKFQERCKLVRQLKKSRRIGPLRVGSKVDIRDDSYVWCRGKVRKLYPNGKERSNRLLVQIQYSKETIIVHIDDQRVASLGSYTNKKQVPHYLNGRVAFQHAPGVQIQLQQSTLCSSQKIS